MGQLKGALAEAEAGLPLPAALRQAPPEGPEHPRALPHVAHHPRPQPAPRHPWASTTGHQARSGGGAGEQWYVDEDGEGVAGGAGPAPAAQPHQSVPPSNPAVQRGPALALKPQRLSISASPHSRLIRPHRARELRCGEGAKGHVVEAAELGPLLLQSLALQPALTR